jgi:hypothetical protein
MTFTSADVVAIIGAVGAFLLSLGAFVKVWKQASASERHSKLVARKDEVELLRSEVCQVHKDLAATQRRVRLLEREYEREHTYRLRLVDYIQELLAIMREKGLKAPPMPAEPPPIEDENDDNEKSETGRKANG